MTEALELATKSLDTIQNKTCVGNEFTGWWDYPRNHGFDLVYDISNHIAGLDFAYDIFLVVGIGGSYLEALAAFSTLENSYSDLVNHYKPLLSFLGHHLSEKSMIEVLYFLVVRETIVNVISKSGTTTDTSVAFRIVRNYMEKLFGKEES